MGINIIAYSGRVKEDSDEELDLESGWPLFIVGISVGNNVGSAVRKICIDCRVMVAELVATTLLNNAVEEEFRRLWENLPVVIADSRF